MRKVLLIIIGFSLMACSSTPEERAEKLIMEYLKENAHDPSSIQDLDVGHLMVRDEDEWGKKGNFKVAVITYRGKNEYGALVKSDFITVRFDEDVTRIICFDCFK